jgi:hypothetical protein
MQTTAGKQRFALGQVRLAAVIIGITGLVAAGAAAVTLTRDAASPTAPAAMQSTVLINPDAVVRREWQRASVTPSRGRSPAESRFMTDNTILPGYTTRSVTPDYRLRDLNVLPGDAVHTTVATQADYRLLDQNVLPGDDARLLPYGALGASY